MVRSRILGGTDFGGVDRGRTYHPLTVSWSNGCCHCEYHDLAERIVLRPSQLSSLFAPSTAGGRMTACAMRPAESRPQEECPSLVRRRWQNRWPAQPR
ncbi:uncharacterized protein BDW47DRAFT_110459 [Aspergillus candidus]|uniref:Uncharacterized protein n=1 Tax=Aspergillus candidus TaxID=41067 RepID=A0A2I2F402_ASPCN|nr:hypothetical protein BDW47DRAFT_110459 [Aspergillus candidus]PLB35367.1 hypothetical protein BDW47DRAFT_110459 [Aspergillus candidus]